MPAKSKAQFRFMKAIQGGYIKKAGLSKKDAEEFLSDNSSYKDLPEKKDRFKKLKKVMRK